MKYYKRSSIKSCDKVITRLLKKIEHRGLHKNPKFLIIAKMSEKEFEDILLNKYLRVDFFVIKRIELAWEAYERGLIE